MAIGSKVMHSGHTHACAEPSPSFVIKNGGLSVETLQGDHALADDGSDRQSSGPGEVRGAGAHVLPAADARRSTVSTLPLRS